MSLSDFISMLGLALAVWALIPSKERRFILLFFSDFEISIFIVLILLIHYFISFDWLTEHWFPKLSYFTVDNGIPNEIWAYSIALFVICYPIVKVSFCFFAESRILDLDLLYKSLIKENEIEILVNYIRKYHIEDIKKYLVRFSYLPKREISDIVLRRKSSFDKEHERLIRSKRLRFAASVYVNILQNEIFVRLAANKYPELFAIAISGIETPQSSNEEFVKIYIECLFEEKNQALIQELKILRSNTGSITERIKTIDLPIVYSLFTKTKVAVRHSVWYPVGEKALQSLKYDRTQKEFLIKEHDSSIESELWNQKIYIAIEYFDYMVKESIYSDSEYHMWLYYFHYFIDSIISIIPETKKYDSSKENPSFAHYLISQQFNIMEDWLELTVEKGLESRAFDIIKCLCQSINLITNADESRLSNEFKIKLFNSILREYFELSTKTNDELSLRLTAELEKMFLLDREVNYMGHEATIKYKRILKATWNQFDKVPYQIEGNRDLIERFIKNVLSPLGIN